LPKTTSNWNCGSW